LANGQFGSQDKICICKAGRGKQEIVRIFPSILAAAGKYTEGHGELWEGCLNKLDKLLKIINKPLLRRSYGGQEGKNGSN
jgi:hypothetical protein